MADLQALTVILKKDPIIHTFTAKELLADPKKVETTYNLHADTHMSLGGTDISKMIDGVVKNQRAFIGGEVGDYGLGKTSLMTYFWKELNENDILAVPPYQWSKFQENFQVLYTWVSHVLKQRNPGLIVELDRLYKEFVEPSVELEAQLAVEKYGFEFEAARKWVEDKYSSGKLIFELTVEDYISFLSKVSELIKQAGFKGLMVFMDELQVTVQDNSLNYVAAVLFQLSSSLMAEQGNFGVFVGMPLSTQAALLQERSDIFDRLQSAKSLIDLSLIYGLDFPEILWDTYAEYFNFEQESSQIVERAVLTALGQICDPKRRDLGNGPRSVVSAFNRIVHHYLNTKRGYTLLDLVQDSLDKEITLGENSKYVQKIKSLLENQFVKEQNLKQSIMVLAGFPKGCPDNIVKKYGVEQEVKYLVDNAYGQIVRETPNGIGLICLEETQVTNQLSILESKIAQFARHFAADSTDIGRALKVFGQMVLPTIFTQKDGLAKWTSPNGREWKFTEVHKLRFEISLIGAFEQTIQYPNRKLKVVICGDGISTKPELGENEFGLYFDFRWKLKEGNQSNSIKKLNQGNFNELLFTLNLLTPMTNYRIPTISTEYIHQKSMHPLFLLALVHFINYESNIPKNERETLNHINRTIIKDLVYHMLNDEMLEIQDSTIELDNQGEQLIKDLFKEICKKTYPKYRTLITSPQWDQRLERYVAVLEKERISINAKRGREPLGLTEPDLGKRRELVAEEFGINRSTFETWAQVLSDLIDLSQWNSEGKLYLKIHPLEQLIIDEIDNCPSDRFVHENGVRCKFADGQEVVQKAKELGYTDEELAFVIQKLGFARKLYKIKMDGGRYLLYRVPVSIEELKAELLDKITGLKKEFAVLTTIQEFKHKFDFGRTESDISKVNSEEEFETIKQIIHAQFQINHRFITTTMASWLDKVSQNFTRTNEDFETFKNQGLMGILNRRLEGRAIWLKNITEIQQGPLKIVFDDIQNDIERERKNVNNLSAYRGKNPREIAETGTDDLRNLQTEIQTIESCLSGIKNRIGTLRGDVEDLRVWQRVLATSESTLDLVLNSKRLGDDSFDTEFEKVSDEIQAHLQRYGKEGLRHHESFQKRLNDISSRAEGYINSFKTNFNSIKALLLEALRNLGSSVSVLRTEFRESDSSRSLHNLYEEAGEAFYKLVIETATKIQGLQADLDYTDHILNKGEKIKEANLDQQLKELKDDVQKLTQKNIETMIQNREGTDEIKTKIEGFSDKYREIYRNYRLLLEPVNPNQQEMKFLSVLDRANEKDLKEVILGYAKTSNGQLSLDEVLNLLKELFVKNHLMIKVKKL